MSDQKTIGKRVNKVVNKVVGKMSETDNERIAAIRISDSKRNDANVRIAVLSHNDGGACEETVGDSNIVIASGPEYEIHDKMRNAADKSRVATPRKRSLAKKKNV